MFSLVVTQWHAVARDKTQKRFVYAKTHMLYHATYGVDRVPSRDKKHEMPKNTGIFKKHKIGVKVMGNGIGMEERILNKVANRLHAVGGSQSCCEIINQRRTPITVDEFQKLMEWTYSDKGVALARAWEWMNEECFDGVLVPCPILLPSSPPFGHWVGLCTGNPQNETVHIQIKRDMTLGEQFNVLLHECLHAYLRELGQSTDHNAIPWCTEIMRLTQQIWGVEIHASPDSPRRINGVSKRVQKPSATGQQSITRTQISRWPHSIGLNVADKIVHNYSQLKVVK